MGASTSSPAATAAVASVPLLPTLALDAAVNAAGYAQAVLAGNSERYYDLLGASTFALCSVFTLVRTLLAFPGAEVAARQAYLLATTAVWSVRLSGFLFARMRRLGEDSRFEKLKRSPVRFAVVWIAQSVWIGVVGLPVYSVLAADPAAVPKWNWVDTVGAGMWAVGFAFEVIADQQKAAWQKRVGADRKKKFISTGLWSLCRYPNYFGEILLWFGTYLVARNTYPGSWGAKYGFAASPLLTAFLLTRVSGISLQEKQAKLRFAGNAEYARYVAETSTLVPWFKRTSGARK
ncbi:hypothetical protein HK405_003185 [Cladochytrium tenue]|nr:hypothetical protein HK405_003185 [Cladochytrium tenue]